MPIASKSLLAIFKFEPTGVSTILKVSETSNIVSSLVFTGVKGIVIVPAGILNVPFVIV